MQRQPLSLARLAGPTIVLASCLAPSLWAQGLGRISGTVTDATGASVPNAKVTATRNGTGEATTVTTDDAGAYVFPSLPPAGYTITATAQGFSTFTDRNAILQADQALTLNVALKVGSTGDVVEVNDIPPQIDTTTGTLSQVIDEHRVNDLPLNGRNAATLTTLVPGVVTAPSTNIDQGQTKTFPVVAAVTVNGTRANQVNFMLDGGNNVDEYTNVNAPFPFPDIVQEFSVETSNYNAEYGQNAGGVVNIITLGGSNKFHGDAFEYVRNPVFDAANYFSYLGGVKVRDGLKRNQFGGTFNGPLYIPHLYNGKDRTFFSFGVQATRYVTTAVAGTALLPTPSELAGTFTGSGTTPVIENPQTLAPYPCTTANGSYTCTVNPADFNASSLALLKYLPTVPNGTGSYNYIKPVFQTYIEYTGRVDQEIGTKDHLTLRYFNDNFNNQGVLNPANLLTYTDGAQISYNNALISETHTFTSKLLNNFILSYQMENASRGPLPGAPSANTLGVNIWQPSFNQINQIQVGSGGAYFTIGDNPQAFFQRNNYTLADDLHWTLGSHNIGIGFHGEVAKIDVNNDYEQPGQFQFNSTSTDVNPMADFLLGGLVQFNQASGQFFNNRYKLQGYYVQDSWKVNRRLTLNYGIRYEPFTPQRELLGREGQFIASDWANNVVSVTHPNALAGLSFPGDPNFTPNMIHAVYDHVMPRFGFAWDVFGDGKTSLRGGGGQFYDTRLPGVLDNVFANTVPFVAAVGNTYLPTKLGNFSDPYARIGPNPFPAPQPPPISFFKQANYQAASYSTFNPATFRVPRTYMFNLALEQQYTSTLSSRIAYVGSQSRHGINPTDINPVWNQGPNIGNRVYSSASNPAQNYPNAIATTDTGGNSNYNSLQASVQKRVSNGLTAFFNYTWSKALDNNPYGAQGVTAVVPGSSYVLPIYEPNYKRLDTGPADYDHRNVVSASYVWTLPELKTGNPVLRYVASHWQTNGIWSFRSGDALTVTGNNGDGTQLNRDRATWNGSNPYGGNACSTTTNACKSWYNKAAFSTNPSIPTTMLTPNNPPSQALVEASYGNIVKGSFVGPRFQSWDVSVMRIFPIHESFQFQFRAEFFNVLNHTIFGDPQASETSSTFGQITTTNGDPRIGQMSLKVLF